jgi:hypothetical protein
MEGNLNKARTSLIVTPKSSPLLGEHMQAGSLYRSISQGGDRRLSNAASPRKIRPTQSLNKGSAPVHARNLSETSVTLASVKNHRTSSEARSASAMEYSYGAKSIDSMLEVRSDSFSSGYTFPPRGAQKISLPVLEEEEPVAETSPESPQLRPRLSSGGLGISSLGAHARSLSGNDVGTNLSRSRSQMTTKEARDHVQRLRKGSGDSVPRRQGMDMARRNSLQNLRSPNAVSTPEDWYTGAAEYKGGSPTFSTNAGMGRRGEEGVEGKLTRSSQSPLSQFSPRSSYSPAGWPVSPQESWIDMSSGALDAPQSRGQEGSASAKSPNLTVTSTRSISDSEPSMMEHDDQNTYIQESQYEDAFEGRTEEVDDAAAASEEEQVFLNEVLEESLHDAEPAVPPIPEVLAASESQRHEDRADAFDYENFFLHSALGNYTQKGLHHRNVSQTTTDSRHSIASVDSVASTDSVETTRPAPREKEEMQFVEDDSDGDSSDNGTSTPTTPRAPFTHLRSNSTDSVSSSATFATATEGGYDGSGEYRSDTMPQEILHWGQGPGGMVGAWPSPPSSQPNNGGFENRGGIAQLIDGHESPLGTPMIDAEGAVSRPGSDQSTPPAKSAPPMGGQQRGVWNGQYGDKAEDEGNDASDTADDDDSIDSQQPPPNTEVLISALVTLANPDFRPRGSFSDIDKDLVVSVLRSVGVACEGINASDSEGDVHETRTWRRRLDTARRILDGEVDVEEE